MKHLISINFTLTCFFSYRPLFSVHFFIFSVLEASDTSGNLRRVCRLWGSPREGALKKQGLDPHRYLKKKSKQAAKKIIITLKVFAHVLHCVMFWWMCVFTCFHWMVGWLCMYTFLRACLFHLEVSIRWTCNAKTKTKIPNCYASKYSPSYIPSKSWSVCKKNKKRELNWGLSCSGVWIGSMW